MVQRAPQQRSAERRSGRRLSGLYSRNRVARAADTHNKFVAYDIKRPAGAIALALVGLSSACSNSSVAMDALPTNTESARHLAETVASSGGCGGFEDYTFNRARDTWVFTCQKPGVSFEVVIYGSEDARTVGLRTLDNNKTTYFSENFYAVAVMRFDGGGPADSALGPFRSPPRN